MGAEGIKKWLRSHTHNLVCEQLGLPSDDEGLSDEELARKLQVGWASVRVLVGVGPGFA